MIALYGSGHSRFLKGIRSAAKKEGIVCQITQTFIPDTFYVADWETVDMSACGRYLQEEYDLERPVPAVSVAVLSLLLREGSLSGKTVLIIGRGNSTKSLPAYFLQEDATVIVAHSKTKNLYELSMCSDVIVCGCANPVEVQGDNRWVADVSGFLEGISCQKYISFLQIGRETIHELVKRMLQRGERDDPPAEGTPAKD